MPIGDAMLHREKDSEGWRRPASGLVVELEAISEERLSWPFHYGSYHRRRHFHAGEDDLGGIMALIEISLQVRTD
jgi:hypothetical protein